MDYELIIILFIGFLGGAGFAALVSWYYFAEEREVEKKKLQQELSAKLTYEFNQEKKELAHKNAVENNQAKFSRQRLVKKIDSQIEQLRACNKEIEILNYKIKDAEYALTQAKDESARLQTAYEELDSKYRTKNGRLVSAENRIDDLQKQLDFLKEQLEQKTKTQNALLFATNELRQTLLAKRALEKRLAYQQDNPPN